MRTACPLLCLSMLLFAASFSGAAQPITGMASGSPPTTAPAEPVSVMLLPFHAVAQGPEYSWISAAIDQDLVDALSRNHAIRLVRPAATQPVADDLAAARDAKVDRLISGSYQVIDGQLRITAEVINVNQTQPAGQVKATGRVGDLFQLEASLAMQLWHVLPRPTEQTSVYDVQVTPLEDYVASESAPALYQSPQPQVSPGPIYDYSPAYDYAPYVSPYPDPYDYGYPYGFGDPFLFFGGNGRHGFHDHGGVRGHDGGGIHSPATGRGGGPSGGFHGGGENFGGGHR